MNRLFLFCMTLSLFALSIGLLSSSFAKTETARLAVSTAGITTLVVALVFLGLFLGSLM